jgi:hypothetical protein
MGEYDGTLNAINRNINTVNENLQRVSTRVESVGNEVLQVQQTVGDIDSRVDSLLAEFREFVQKDLMQKELQLAETRIVKVRQELTDKFGYYDEVRRVAVGILQAADVNVVRQDVLSNCTEELMLRAPGYWLAPCLIALASWLNDNKDLAERALQEAIRRNDERTALFFALVSRRAGRFDATERWLERYLSMQDPTALQRDMVIVLDAFASGLLGSDSSGICSKRIQEWVTDLSNRAGFVEGQRTQWVEAFRSKIKAVEEQEFPYLRKYSPTWPQLQQAMQGVRLHRTLKDHFANIISGEFTPAQTLAFKIDEILDNLVTNFDEEELPLRRDERLLNLIVECDGDRQMATQKMSVEKSLADTIDFTQLLTNAAMQPETTGASKATQRLSVALSKEWIRTAYDDLTAQLRGAVPAEIDLSISEWKGKTRDGSNEKDLLASLELYLSEWYKKASANLKLGTTQYVVLGIIGFVSLLFLFGQAWFFAILGLAGGAIYYFVTNDKMKKQRSQLDLQYEGMKKDMPQILKAALAEVVDWRKQWATEDAVSSELGLLFDQITPSQFISNSFNKARVVL